MQLAWLTDIHLNFVGRTEVNSLCDDIRTSGAAAVLITGDIASALYLTRYLDNFASSLQMPVYFVLGNHDYYGSSIREINDAVGKLISEMPQLIWLSACLACIPITDNTCLVGHEGLADGRLGDPEGSEVMINDYYQITELMQPSKRARLEVQHQLGDDAAAHLRSQLKQAIDASYRKILVALHVPPFPEACWHMGEKSTDEFLPHFGCQATGEVLREFALTYSLADFTVYCGHTHSSGVAEILPNLRVFTGRAKYGRPQIERLFTVE
ncbi:metallophosphoesterase family protein [Oryzomonas rubra]|nr:metallophosphoesterase [Oryzomonas rubra]